MSFAVKVKAQLPEEAGVNVTVLPDPDGYPAQVDVQLYAYEPVPPDATALTGIDWPTLIVTGDEGFAVTCSTGLTVITSPGEQRTLGVVAWSTAL